MNDMYGMKTASPKHIMVFDNFVEPDDLAVLDGLCRNTNIAQWWYEKHPSRAYTEHTTGKYRQLCEKYNNPDSYDHGHPLLRKYMKKVRDLVSFESGHELVEMFEFNRNETRAGGFCPGHTDAEGFGPIGIDYLVDYSPMHGYEPSLIDISANIYINNDYVGGQLYFEAYGIEINHTPGQLVFFPGSVEYNHGVRRIESGTRWNLITHFARPKLIQMHNALHNMYVELNENQKNNFPISWNKNSVHRANTGENSGDASKYV